MSACYSDGRQLHNGFSEANKPLSGRRRAGSFFLRPT